MRLNGKENKSDVEMSGRGAQVVLSERELGNIKS